MFTIYVNGKALVSDRNFDDIATLGRDIRCSGLKGVIRRGFPTSRPKYASFSEAAINFAYWYDPRLLA